MRERERGTFDSRYKKQTCSNKNKKKISSQILSLLVLIEIKREHI